MPRIRRLLAMAVFLTAELAVGGEPERADKSFDDQVRPFLARHCLECHGAEKPKGDLRLDRLSLDFADDVTRERWLAVLSRVEANEMPLKGNPWPPQREIRALSHWLREKTKAAGYARRAA